jgi:DNA-binding response OmpR family regulator
MTYLPRILLVDDEMDFLLLSCSFLKKNGFDVLSLSDGFEVVSTAKAYNPHIIVLDVRLGKHDGMAICRQLKDDLDTKSIRVILHSAFSDVQKEYHKCGADEFILKPYTFDHLISRLNYHLV